VGILNRFLDPPGNATPTERHNFRVAYRESALIGFIAAGSVFLPVFLVRLGATNFQVGLVSALPSLMGVLLAIPLGSVIQSRRNIIPWYSRGRLGGQLGYVAIAVVSFVLPPDLAVPGILAVWAIVALFSTVTNISFAVVMDATAGGTNRYELMSRRWSILGLMNALALVLVGQALGWLAFPLNYQVILAALGILGLAAFRYAAAIRVPDHPPREKRAGAPRYATIQDLVARVRTQPAFLAFAGRHFVWALGAAIAVPLLPLFYVRVLGASDGWIGIIGTTQALMVLVGYTVWRRASKKRGSRFVLVWSTLGAAAIPAVLALTRDEAFAAAIVGIGAIFTAGVNLAIFDRMMTIVPKGYGVTFVSVDTSVIFAAGIIGPLLAAVLADHIGLASALFGASIASFIGAMFFALDKRPPATQDPAADGPASPAHSRAAPQEPVG